MVAGTVNPSVVDPVLGDLVLRIRGSSRDGQMLHLKSTKCTIGSGPNCTLRLRVKGVDPVHCVILRGPNGALIRRWSSNTRLNGEAFTTAPLSIGDRLNIGPVEFEIVSDRAISAGASAPAVAPVQFQQHEPIPTPRDKTNLDEESRLNDLKKQLSQKGESLDLQMALYEKDAADLKEERRKFETERRRWEDTRAASIATDTQDKDTFETRAEQLEKDAALLREERDKFEAERRQWEDLRDSSISLETERHDAQVEEQVAQLKAGWAELEANRQAWNMQKQRWQAELDASQQKLQDLEQKINEREAELNASAAELKTRQSQLDIKTSALEFRDKQLTDQAEELARQNAKKDECFDELSARRKKLDDQSAELETHVRELQNKTAELDDRSRQLDAQTAKIEKQAAEMKKQMTELHARSDELHAKAEELDSMRLEIGAQHDQWNKSCRARDKTLAEKESEINEKITQLEATQEQLRVKQEQYDSYLAQQERDRQKSESQPIERKPTAEEFAGAELPETAALAISHVSEEPAEGVETLCGTNEEIQYATEVPTFGQAVLPPAGGPNHAGVTAPAAANGHTAEHEEESLDDYMARLMDRIRTAQGELSADASKSSPPAAKKQETPPPPGESKPSAPAMPAFKPAQIRNPYEISPHTVAPEKNLDLTLLRDLANYSAKSAIGTHARFLMTRIMYTKLSVALIGGVTGLGLLWLWRTWFPHNLTLLSAMLSFVVAMIYGIQYLMLTMKLLSHGTEEPVQSSKHKDDATKSPTDAPATAITSEINIAPQEDLKVAE